MHTRSDMAHDIARVGVAALIVVLAAPMVPRLLPASVAGKFAYLRYLPDAMVDTTLSGEQAIGQAYLGAAYAARDLSAAAYGGIATNYVNALYAVHGAQQRAYALMGGSMADGAFEVGVAIEGVGQWYDASAARIQHRVEQAQTP